MLGLLGLLVGRAAASPTASPTASSFLVTGTNSSYPLAGASAGRHRCHGRCRCDGHGKFDPAVGVSSSSFMMSEMVQ